MVNIAILSSGTGNSSKILLENIKNKTINSVVNVIVTNKADAQIIELAKLYKISYIYLPKKKDISNINYDIQLLTILKSYNIDIIFLIGYMRIITSTIINNYKNKIFNIHPSLLPKYKNMMDLDIHEKVIENNDLYTGCTLHIVEEEVDEGAIILQKKTKVLTNDKFELKNTVQELENECILMCVKLIENNNIHNILIYDNNTDNINNYVNNTDNINNYVNNMDNINNYVDNYYVDNNINDNIITYETYYKRRSYCCGIPFKIC